MMHLIRDRFQKVIAPILMVVILGVSVGSINVSIDIGNADLFSLEIDFDNEMEEDRLSDEKISDPSKIYQQFSKMAKGRISCFNDTPLPITSHYLSISTPPPDLEIPTLLV